MKLGKGVLPRLVAAPDGTTYAFWVNESRLEGAQVDENNNVLRDLGVCREEIEGSDFAISVRERGNGAYDLIMQAGSGDNIKRSVLSSGDTVFRDES